MTDTKICVCGPVVRMDGVTGQDPCAGSRAPGPDALRALAEAREAVRAGDVAYSAEAVHALVKGRRAS